MDAPVKLEEASKRALRLIVDRKVVSGWELASVVGGPDKLKAAIEPLVASGLVDFGGDWYDEERLLKSYFNLRLSRAGEAKSALL